MILKLRIRLHMTVESEEGLSPGVRCLLELFACLVASSKQVFNIFTDDGLHKRIVSFVHVEAGFEI